MLYLTDKAAAAHNGTNPVKPRDSPRQLLRITIFIVESVHRLQSGVCPIGDNKNTKYRKGTTQTKYLRSIVRMVVHDASPNSFSALIIYSPESSGCTSLIISDILLDSSFTIYFCVVWIICTGRTQLLKLFWEACGVEIGNRTMCIIFLMDCG